MSRKTNDAPLKLIQLVPSNGNEEAPSLSSPDEYDHGLRLQIGIEGDPSWGTRMRDVLTRAVTRHSHRMTNHQEIGNARGPIVKKTGLVATGLSKFLEAVQFLFHQVGVLLVGCKQILVSVWTRFHQADDDLDDLMQARLDRKSPPRSDDSNPSREVATAIDRTDDVLAKEIHALREEFNAQQYELSRVNNFVVDLKSRVVAQQKMILSLAEELDAIAMDVPDAVKDVSKESGAVQRH